MPFTVEKEPDQFEHKKDLMDRATYPLIVDTTCTHWKLSLDVAVVLVGETGPSCQPLDGLFIPNDCDTGSVKA